MGVCVSNVKGKTLVQVHLGPLQAFLYGSQILVSFLSRCSEVLLIGIHSSHVNKIKCQWSFPHSNQKCCPSHGSNLRLTTNIRPQLILFMLSCDIHQSKLCLLIHVGCRVFQFRFYKNRSVEDIHYMPLSSHSHQDCCLLRMIPNEHS